jgi:hypothetical protein
MRGLERRTPSQVFLSLIPADGDDAVASLIEGFSTVVHVSADGSFEWKNVPAGHYYVQFSGDDGVSSDWFLKSVIVGSRDATEPGFSINGGAAVIDLVASADGAVIDGVVLNAKGDPVANAVVVAVPETPLRARADRFRKAVSDQSGYFTLHAIPPGSYTLLAWETVEGEAYYNPEFLRTCEGQGRVLHVSEGERKSLQLAVAPVSEDQP